MRVECRVAGAKMFKPVETIKLSLPLFGGLINIENLGGAASLAFACEIEDTSIHGKGLGLIAFIQGLNDWAETCGFEVRTRLGHSGKGFPCSVNAAVQRRKIDAQCAAFSHFSCHSPLGKIEHHSVVVNEVLIWLRSGRISFGEFLMSKPELTDAAKRALAEAEERRQKAAKPVMALEVNGTKGPEPTRFGDWEKNGIASDF
jgi:hypothetical protein